MNRLVTPAILSSSSMRADKSVRLSMVTNELTDEEWILLKRMQNQGGFMLFQDNELSEDDLSMFDEIDEDLYDTPKSPSQRIRDRLFILYKKGIEGSPADKGFKEFYKRYTEKELQRISDLIPE